MNKPQRSIDTPGFRITTRDLDLVTDVFLHGVLTRDQIRGLGYFQSIQRTNLRLAKLVKAKLLRPHPHVPGRTGFQRLYIAARSAVPYLTQRLEADKAQITQRCRKTAAPTNLEHLMAITEVRIAFREATLKDRDFSAAWVAELRARHAYGARFEGGDSTRKVLKPDGLIRCRWVGPAADLNAYLEVDRGMVSLPRFETKVKSYVDYLHYGVFERVLNSANGAVLVITTGERRLKHLMRLTSKSKRPVFAFTTEQAFKEAGPLAAIWRVEGFDQGMSLVGLRDTVQLFARRQA